MLLQKEFPQIRTITLPSYNIRYPKNPSFLKWKLLLQLPHIKKAMAAEHKITEGLVSEGKIQGIISDSRFGVYSEKIPSVFITHQLQVLSGSTSYFSSKIHQKIIKKFDVCWVPDIKAFPINYSGKLGHLENTDLPVKHIGILSRMQKQKIPKRIEVLILISGPEPQRTAFEEMLKPLFIDCKKRVLMIRGVVENVQKREFFGILEVVNFMTGSELEKVINQSELVICRSGYTSIMDLSILEKQVFFIPTPGQFEQEYLAEHLEKQGVAPFCKQSEFKMEQLNRMMDYKGLQSLPKSEINFADLFSIFKGKGKF